MRPRRRCVADELIALGLQSLDITVNVVNPNIVPAILLNASLALFYADARAGTPIKFGAVQVT